MGCLGWCSIDRGEQAAELIARKSVKGTKEEMVYNSGMGQCVAPEMPTTTTSNDDDDDDSVEATNDGTAHPTSRPTSPHHNRFSAIYCNNGHMKLSDEPDKTPAEARPVTTDAGQRQATR